MVIATYHELSSPSVEFHPEAAEELNEAAAYYEIELAGLGERLVSEVERIIDLLVENPEIGAPVETELRHFFRSLLSDCRRTELATSSLCDSVRLRKLAPLRLPLLAQLVEQATTCSFSAPPRRDKHRRCYHPCP